METIKQILAAIFVMTFITSCDKDEIAPKEALEKATISAKWNVNNSSEYESFEFNESGNYIIVKSPTTESPNDRSVFFGTYEIIDNITIVLSDFGTFTSSEIYENSISFSIQLTSNPDNEIIINASKQEEIENTTKTELLCRTWKIISINGEDVVGTGRDATILFSKAGTYLCTIGVAHWKWKDDAETQWLYSWCEVPIWDENDCVEIIELTDSTLKMKEEWSSGTGITHYVLKPAINTKSAIIKSSIETTRKTEKKGLLKK